MRQEKARFSNLEGFINGIRKSINRSYMPHHIFFPEDVIRNSPNDKEVMIKRKIWIVYVKYEDRIK